MCPCPSQTTPEPFPSGICQYGQYELYMLPPNFLHISIERYYITQDNYMLNLAENFLRSYLVL